MKKSVPARVLLERRLLAAVGVLSRDERPRALGLSGGMDSVLLAEALVRCGVAFQVWHFNHGWRGAASAEDAAWVRAWCRKHDVRFSTARAPLGNPATEGRGRELRWAFFCRQAKRTGVRELWLAHHADDRAETFLLQLLRGAGPSGLPGPGVHRPMFGIQVVRPLTGFRRSELATLARAWKLEWREDASNADLRYRRNAVRRRLLPYLDRLAGRQVAPLLARTADILEAENVYWDSILPEHPGPRLRVRELKIQPTAWQRRLIYRWLTRAGLRDVAFADVEAVRGLLDLAGPARINLTGGVFCRRTAGFIYLQG